MSEGDVSSDHNLTTQERYRELDRELMEAEQEMEEVDEQLRLWHIHQEEKRKRGLRFG